jgi:aldehyde:ferredoxin oxidoreductase
MELYGYAGKILYVDLTNNKIREESLDPELVSQFIGGWGINAKLYCDCVPPRIDPLSPENALIFGSGPFVGTMIPGSSRTYITHKHPLSGTIGAATGTGFFSYMLKSSGFDHVVVTGKAPEPVYLKIDGDRIELADAQRLWGMDTYETVFTLRSEFEPCSVIAIGQAGENQVKISVTHTDTGQGAMGQGGMPAVFGSKNLKAIVVRQGATPIRVADADRLHRAVDKVLERVSTYPRLDGLREGGGWYMMRGGMMGRGVSDKESVDHEAVAFEAHKRSRSNIACPNCPVACRERIRLKEGDHEGLLTYSTMTTGGALNAVGVRLDYNQAVKYIDTMNRYGVDSMFFNDILGLVFSLYEEGRIGESDLGGLECKRDFDSILNIARMVAHREGFGDVIADGIVSVCRHLGLDPEDDAMHIKGWNRVIDARFTGASPAMFSQMLEVRGPTGIAGATHPPGYQPGQPPGRWLKYAREQGLPPEAEDRIFTENSFNPARLLKWMHDYWSVLQSLGFCGRLYITRFHDLSTMTEYFEAVTGREMSSTELLTKGEQNWTLNKLLNIREGFGRQDDRPPDAWFQPLKVKGLEHELHLMDYYRTKVLSRQDVESLLDDYYDERGWDKETTAPTPEKLKMLGLEKLGSYLK